jgi:hypothetical protein
MKSAKSLWCVVSAVAAVVGPAGLALGQAGNVTIPKDTTQQTEPKDKAKTTEKRVDLRPKFREGETHRFAISLRSKAVQAASGGKDKDESEQVSNNDLTIKMNVASTTEEGSTLEVTYESIRFEVKNDAMEISFDSSKPAANDDPLTDSLLRPLVGLTLQVQTDKTGNITKVDAGSVPSGVPGNIMTSFTGADVVRRMFGPITTLKAGDGFASVGESWTNESSMAGGGGGTSNMRMKLNYTLRSQSGSTAKLGIEGKVLFEGGNALPIAIKDSAISGTADWNTERGMLESMNMTQRLVVESTLVLPENVMEDNSTSSPATTVQQTTMTVRRL